MNSLQGDDIPRSSEVQVLERLPLELLRLIASFCSSDEVIFVLPLVSNRLYSACHDVELMKTLLRRDIRKHISPRPSPKSDFSPATLPPTSEAAFDLHTSQAEEHKNTLLVERIINNIESSVKVSNESTMFFARWVVLLEKISSVPPGPRNQAGFRGLLRLMQYLPHAILAEIPLSYSKEQRNGLIELIANYFLDVSGGPGFRSRLYTGGLNMTEINLRMAICLSWLIMHHESPSDLFRNVNNFGDQSLSSWIGTAILFSQDYLWLNNMELSQAKRRINHQGEVFLTIMGMAAALLHRRPFDRPPFPATSILQQYSKQSLLSLPSPFDILPVELSSTESWLTFSHFFDIQRSSFANEESISQKPWCGFYIPEQKYDLRAYVFSPPLRDIHFHASKVTEQKWDVTSDAILDGFGESTFSGTLEADDKTCTLFLTRKFNNLYKEHWRGQISPFGISGSYFVEREDGRASPGGLFWLWMEE